MRPAAVVAVALVALLLSACGTAPRPAALVLALESPDPAGIEHDPAVGFFAARVARLSGGRLRIAVADYPRGKDGSVDEAGLLRAVARGDAPLGWAHTGSFDALRVHGFDAFGAPMLIDNYATETAVVHSELAKRMLADVNDAGLDGMALLAGPLDRLVDMHAQLRNAGEIRGHGVALRPSPVGQMAVRALGGDPLRLSFQLIAQGPPPFLEDDLDSTFFDRFGGRCDFTEAYCATSRPRVTTNVVLGASPEVIVANPDRLRRLSARERSWLARAAADATAYSATVADQDERLAPELCAAGVRFSTAPPAAVAALRRAWRPLYARLERGPAGSAIREILTLRSRRPAAEVLSVPTDCRRRPQRAEVAHGVRSTLRDGVYRLQVSPADIRAAGAENLGVLPAVETLTLRNGHWRIDYTEPGSYAHYGTYAGTPLRTAWFTVRGGQLEEEFFSIVASRLGLRFYIVQSWSDYRVEHAVYGSHLWLRIGN